MIADVCIDQMTAINRKAICLEWHLRIQCKLSVILINGAMSFDSYNTMLIPLAVRMSVVHPTDRIVFKFFMKLTDFNGVAISKPKAGGKESKMTCYSTNPN